MDREWRDDSRSGGASRRELLKAAAATAAVAGSSGALAAPSRDDITWMPAGRIRDLIAAKQISPVEVTDHFLGRIERLNPTLKAFKHLDAEGARKQAKLAEQAVMRGEPLGPLHGLPTAVKEHVEVAGMPVLRLGGGGDSPIAERDAIGVERLRAAGAIIVGTNTMMGTSAPAPGRYNWEAEARNPWDPTRVTGWSSSGGAAAAVARLLPFTIGSDGGGSTRLPGALSGLVGYHPSVGRIPNVNYARNSLTLMTTIGPLARDVSDCALVMQVMAGPDGRDFAAIRSDAPEFLSALGRGVRGFRFAWTDDFGYGAKYALPEAPQVIAAVRSAAQGFSKLGARIEPTAEVWEEFWPGFRVSSTFYEAGSARLDATPSPDVVRGALETRERNYARFRKLFSSYDLLLSPTIPFTAMKVEDWDAAWTRDGAKYPHGTFAPTYTVDTHMFNWLGFPAVSVPCGFIGGLPIGLQIVGLPDREAKVLQAAAAFQKAFPRNERPRIS